MGNQSRQSASDNAQQGSSGQQPLPSKTQKEEAGSQKPDHGTGDRNSSHAPQQDAVKRKP